MDLRVIKTEELIIHTFLECLAEKDFIDTSVKDITQRARINRSTFYRHYEDKYQLRDHIFDILLAEFETNLGTEMLVATDLSQQKHRNLMSHILTVFGKRKWEYEILWNSMLMGRNFFEEMIERGVTKITADILFLSSLSPKKREQVDWYARLLINNLLVSVRWWFSHMDTVSADMMAEMIIENMVDGTVPTLLK